MTNRDTQAALDFHEGTKHPHGRLLNPHHRYSREMRLLTYKKYLDLESIPLPDGHGGGAKGAGEPETGLAPALQAIASAAALEPAAPDVKQLARLLYLSNGYTKTIIYPGIGEMRFRAAACTGALFHIELYLVCGELEGLDAGVYHYDADADALRPLRWGDFRAALVAASGGHHQLRQAAAALVFTHVPWRNAVKYQARAYRHAFWDSGTILSHVLAVAAAQGLPAEIVLGFADDALNHLLGLDGRREMALGLVPLGYDPGASLPASPAVDPLDLRVERTAGVEGELPAIIQIHRASSLADPETAAAWRSDPAGAPAAPEPVEGRIALPTMADPPDAPIGRVILRRGSARLLAREPIAAEQLGLLLARAHAPVPADFLAAGGGSLVRPYLVVNAVAGLAAGSYAYHPASGELEPLREGDFRRHAGHLALGQDLAADAAVNIYYLADLGRALDRFGNRGYRAAQLEAAVTAGRVYLAAYALGLGATGLTFFDDEVTAFFSPHAAGMAVMFLMAIGKYAR
ncbi:MAG TPA: SagB family peptide dehydrogenase [Anaerolineales bacterium]|nr:SagB family peptide dehydrogenase [Anaerolineales bacterium]